MIRFYSKEGRPITLESWSQLFEFPKYRIIAQDNVGRMFVSTVWLGLDHAFHFFDDDGPPLIFETMVFDAEDLDHQRDDLSMRRYSTLEEARQGHADYLEIVKAIEQIDKEAES